MQLITAVITTPCALNKFIMSQNYDKNTTQLLQWRAHFNCSMLFIFQPNVTDYVNNGQRQLIRLLVNSRII